MMIWEWISANLSTLAIPQIITGTPWDYVIFTVIIAVVSSITIQRNFFPYHDFWEKQNVNCYNPGFWQLMRDSLRQDMHIVEIERWNKYGRIYGRYDGKTPVITIGDPEVLKATVVKESGVFTNRRFFKVGDPIMDYFVSSLRDDDWKRVRNVLTPCFTGSKLRHMKPKIIRCVDRTVASLEATIGSCVPANLEKYFSALTMDVIATCAFGATINSLNSPNHPFVVNAKKMSGAGRKYGTVAAQFCPILLKLFRMTIFDRDAGEFFRKFVLDVIKERDLHPKGKDSPSDDFIQMLVEARKDGEESIPTPERRLTVLPLKSEEKYVTDEELISQCVMFFFAGYDTVKSTLQVTMFHLAQNRDIQDKLFDEINEIVGDKEVPDYEDLSTKLKYLEAVLSEGLRLTSSCIRMEREVKSDYVIPNLGIQLKKGQLVSLPIYAIHHDPKLYPDPQRFDPERFSAEMKAERHQYAYIPFGLGKRSCIGNRFAMMEMKIIMIHVLKAFKLSPSPDMKPKLTGYSKLGTFVPHKVLVNIEPRL